jgi:hypothetical protein
VLKIESREKESVKGDGDAGEFELFVTLPVEFS